MLAERDHEVFAAHTAADHPAHHVGAASLPGVGHLGGVGGNDLAGALEILLGDDGSVASGRNDGRTSVLGIQAPHDVTGVGQAVDDLAEDGVAPAVGLGLVIVFRFGRRDYFRLRLRWMSACVLAAMASVKMRRTMGHSVG